MNFKYWHFVPDASGGKFPCLREELGDWFNDAFTHPVWTAILMDDIKDSFKLDQYIKLYRPKFFYEWGSNVYIYCGKLEKDKIEKLLNSFEQQASI